MILSHGLRDQTSQTQVRGLQEGKDQTVLRRQRLKTSLHHVLMPQCHGNRQSPADIWASRGLWDGPASGGQGEEKEGQGTDFTWRLTLECEKLLAGRSPAQSCSPATLVYWDRASLNHFSGPESGHLTAILPFDFGNNESDKESGLQPSLFLSLVTVCA